MEKVGIVLDAIEFNPYAGYLSDGNNRYKPVLNHDRLTKIGKYKLEIEDGYTSINATQNYHVDEENMIVYFLCHKNIAPLVNVFGLCKNDLKTGELIKFIEIDLTQENRTVAMTSNSIFITDNTVYILALTAHSVSGDNTTTHTNVQGFNLDTGDKIYTTKINALTNTQVNIPFYVENNILYVYYYIVNRHVGNPTRYSDGYHKYDILGDKMIKTLATQGNSTTAIIPKYLIWRHNNNHLAFSGGGNIICVNMEELKVSYNTFIGGTNSSIAVDSNSNIYNMNSIIDPTTRLYNSVLRRTKIEDNDNGVPYKVDFTNIRTINGEYEQSNPIIFDNFVYIKELLTKEVLCYNIGNDKSYELNADMPDSLPNYRILKTFEVDDGKYLYLNNLDVEVFKLNSTISHYEKVEN